VTRRRRRKRYSLVVGMMMRDAAGTHKVEEKEENLFQ
jgi:hypothetical protein